MSSDLFRPDNPFNTVMGRIGDLAMLSIAWFVCSIPIVTIGPATSAACEVAREIVEDTDEGVFRTFIRAFKHRFGVNMLFSLTFIVLFAIGAVDLWYISRQSGDSASLVYGITLGALVIAMMMLSFVLPLSGRSKLSWWEQIKQSARLALMKPLLALGNIALIALPFVLMWFVPGAVVWVPILWCILGAGVSMWAIMRWTCKTFHLKPRDTPADADTE